MENTSRRLVIFDETSFLLFQNSIEVGQQQKIMSYVATVQMKCLFLIAGFERAAKIRKIAVYSFVISLLGPEL